MANPRIRMMLSTGLLLFLTMVLTASFSGPYNAVLGGMTYSLLRSKTIARGTVHTESWKRVSPKDKPPVYAYCTKNAAMLDSQLLRWQALVYQYDYLTRLIDFNPPASLAQYPIIGLYLNSFSNKISSGGRNNPNGCIYAYHDEDRSQYRAISADTNGPTAHHQLHRLVIALHYAHTVISLEGSLFSNRFQPRDLELPVFGATANTHPYHKDAQALLISIQMALKQHQQKPPLRTALFSLIAARFPLLDSFMSGLSAGISSETTIVDVLLMVLRKAKDPSSVTTVSPSIDGGYGTESAPSSHRYQHR